MRSTRLPRFPALRGLPLRSVHWLGDSLLCAKLVIGTHHLTIAVTIQRDFGMFEASLSWAGQNTPGEWPCSTGACRKTQELKNPPEKGPRRLLDEHTIRA